MIQSKYTYANAAIGNKSEVLQDIHLASRNIAIYQRDVDALKKDLNLLIDEAVECRASGTVVEILADLEAYFDSLPGKCPMLLKDISEILDLFEMTSKAPSFRLLLTTVNTNMCRKFHTDMNDLRLLCTYIGPGTLWIPDEAIDQEALKGKEKNEDLIIDLKQIQQVFTGDVVILKGALYPEANPILHRSPTIEENGEKRLLLRIDTNKFLNSFIS